MDFLAKLGDSLEGDKRDSWRKRVTLFEDRLADEDEFRLFLDAVALSHTSLSNEICSLKEELGLSEAEAGRIEKAVVQAINVPSFNELREYLGDVKKVSEDMELTRSKLAKQQEAIELERERLAKSSSNSSLTVIIALVIGLVAGLIGAFTPLLLDILK